MQKRSLSLAGHRTSVSLEPAFWRVLEHEAALEGVSLPLLVGRVDRDRLADTKVSGEGSPPNLASALRVFVLVRLEERASSVCDEAERRFAQDELSVKS